MSNAGDGESVFSAAGGMTTGGRPAGDAGMRGVEDAAPYGVLSKQEGVIKGETRSCPLEIASARSAGKHVSAETCAIENPTTASRSPSL